jgi:pectinesterase
MRSEPTERATVLYVDPDGADTFRTIAEALGAARGAWGMPIEIRIAAGTYREKLAVSQPFVTLFGAGAECTVIVWNDGASEILADGKRRGTFRTATLLVDGESFTAKNLTIENDAGPGPIAGQAIALYVDAENALIENCHILGWQDTLFLAPLPPTEYEAGGFRGPKERAPRRVATCRFIGCRIEGSVDFIFGGARALFEHCDIASRDIASRNFATSGDGNAGYVGDGYVTAPCTPEGERVGFVFRECAFMGECAPRSVYLARPWRDHAKAAFIMCELGAHIREEGFHDWGKQAAHATVEFAEYGNTGPGAPAGTASGTADENAKRRAPFARVLTESEAETLVELAGINRPGRS